MVDELFVWIFDGLKSRHADDLAAVRAQYPTAEEPVYARPTLRLTFREAIALLNNAPADGSLTDRFLRRHVLDDFDGLSRVDERRLMRAVKQQYGVDFFIVDKRPSNCTSSSAMPCPHEPVRCPSRSNNTNNNNDTHFTHRDRDTRTPSRSTCGMRKWVREHSAFTMRACSLNAAPTLASRRCGLTPRDRLTHSRGTLTSCPCRE